MALFDIQEGGHWNVPVGFRNKMNTTVETQEMPFAGAIPIYQMRTTKV